MCALRKLTGARAPSLWHYEIRRLIISKTNPGSTVGVTRQSRIASNFTYNFNLSPRKTTHNFIRNQDATLILHQEDNATLAGKDVTRLVSLCNRWGASTAYPAVGPAHCGSAKEKIQLSSADIPELTGCCQTRTVRTP
jgi:hypothetical protein